MIDIQVPNSVLRDPKRFGGITQGDMRRGRPVLRDGRIVALTPPQGGAAHVVLPKLVEAHCHLDKCHTQHRLSPTGGDLPHAIAQQRADKANWTESDLRTRAARGLAEAQAASCHLIRSHVDWGDAAAPPLAWSVLGELAQDHPGLQRAALTGVLQWTDARFAATVARQLEADKGVLGAFVYDQPGFAQGLRAIFDAAVRHALPLDFHVDEGLGDMNGLEVIADTAIATGYDRPILCGHAVSLMDRADADLARIIDKLLAARIHICALPTTNLYLQGRTDGTPDRRGLTRLRELHAGGVPIIIGSDNVADAFCPTGAHDPMAALSLAGLAAHLDPPLGRWLTAITTHAAAALGHAPAYIDTAPLAAMSVYDAPTLADVIAGRAAPVPATQVFT
ncbi:amidohydrolase family protein [uncultured Tateyamaria sp.]|uniref:amidohydrolase family protein n=1 Tax=Tateyamaria sp. 1078 TaxID=3417464 RepID=UPI0026264CDB|nr:amidohydrolase family protein [uncultured Tateyamaria sp.]